jgi:hypothetical protein
VSSTDINFRSTEYHVTVSPISEILSEAEIEKILENGLIDIHPVIKLMNNYNLNRQLGFICSALPQYIMPSEFNTCLPEIDGIIEKAKITTIESEIDNLPAEVYGGTQKFNNPISSLELD